MGRSNRRGHDREATEVTATGHKGYDSGRGEIREKRGRALRHSRKNVGLAKKFVLIVSTAFKSRVRLCLKTKHI